MEATQLLKGVLDAAVLATVEQADGYGYDVVRRLRDAGLEEVGDASVYGTLRRLYAAGYLSTYVVPSDDGPHRKYYAITATGAEALEQQRADWRRFVCVISSVIGPDEQQRLYRPVPAQIPENPATASTASEGVGA